jgi:hypothetical protein
LPEGAITTSLHLDEDLTHQVLKVTCSDDEERWMSFATICPRSHGKRQLSACALTVGSTLGGVVGGRMAQRLNQTLLQGLIITFGFGITVYFFHKYYWLLS